MNNVSPTETKRIRMKVKAARYSIGAADSPDVRVWVKDAPGVYSKPEFGAAATNVENRQTFNAGDLKAWAPVDIYSRVRWSFDGGTLEGWTDAEPSSSANAEDKTKGLVLTTTGEDPQLIGPETAFSASAYTAISIKGTTTLSGAGRVYFATDSAPGFDESRSVPFTMKNGETLVPLSGNAAWTGTITQLRIDPAPSGTGTVTFDEIRMTNGSAPPAGDAPASEESGGCGCRVTPRSNASGWFALLITLGALRRVDRGRKAR
jgi:MYXO-CTERM domain-containing protein